MALWCWEMTRGVTVITLKKIIVAPDSEYSRQVWQNSVLSSLIPGDTRDWLRHFRPVKVTQFQFLFFSLGDHIFSFFF